MNDDVLVAILNSLPQILLIGLVGTCLVVFRRPIAERLLPNLNAVSFMGLQVTFARTDLDAAVQQKHVQVSADDRTEVLARARWVAPVLEGARILWVDDHPEWNNAERAVMNAFGIRVDVARTTGQALGMLRSNTFDAVITDIDREEPADGRVSRHGEPANASRKSPQQPGFRLLDEMRSANLHRRTIFYVGDFREERGVPSYAFGITNRPDHLLHLIMDALERDRTGNLPRTPPSAASGTEAEAPPHSS